jgi:hypothetical protein
MPKNAWEFSVVDRKYEAAYFEQRFRNRIYEAVIKAVEQAAQENNWKRKDLAVSIGKKPSQLTKWLAGPGNWTLDTVSNLLFAINAELDFTVSFFAQKVKSNELHDLNWPSPLPPKTTPKSVDTTGGTVVLPSPPPPPQMRFG